jgi:hypothetical protein
VSQEKVSGLMVSGRVESGKHKRMAWFTLVVFAGGWFRLFGHEPVPQDRMVGVGRTRGESGVGETPRCAFAGATGSHGSGPNRLARTIVVSRVDLAQCAWVADDAPLSGGVVRLMNLREADPVFSAQLNALVGELQPVSVSDEAEGELVVKMRLNRDLALDLVRASRLRLNEAEGR